MAIAAVGFLIDCRLRESGPYKVLKTAKVGGVGGFDYVDNDGESWSPSERSPVRLQ